MARHTAASTPGSSSGVGIEHRPEPFRAVRGTRHEKLATIREQVISDVTGCYAQPGEVQHQMVESTRQGFVGLNAAYLDPGVDLEFGHVGELSPHLPVEQPAACDLQGSPDHYVRCGQDGGRWFNDLA